MAGLSLTVSAGDRVGLVGENGAGKTTVLRLLAGDLVPVAGRVRRAGTLAGEVAQQVGELLEVLDLGQVELLTGPAR